MSDASPEPMASPEDVATRGSPPPPRCGDARVPLRRVRRRRRLASRPVVGGGDGRRVAGTARRARRLTRLRRGRGRAAQPHPARRLPRRRVCSVAHAPGRRPRLTAARPARRRRPATSPTATPMAAVAPAADAQNVPRTPAALDAVTSPPVAVEVEEEGKLWAPCYMRAAAAAEATATTTPQHANAPPTVGVAGSPAASVASAQSPIGAGGAATPPPPPPPPPRGSPTRLRGCRHGGRGGRRRRRRPRPWGWMA